MNGCIDCGVFLGNGSPVCPSLAREKESRRLITSRRGPDSSNILSVEKNGFRLDMFSSVLQIQGELLCHQPCESEGSESALLWNGEYLNHPASDRSDTALILEKLVAGGNHVPTVLDSIEGPFAFVYFDSSSKQLWFGKDKVGRRSLLVSLADDGNELSISSTALSGGNEVAAGEGIFSLCLTSGLISLHTWPKPVEFSSPKFLSGSSNYDIYQLKSHISSGILRHMQSLSIKSQLGILFSGGVDSVIIASIAAEVVGDCPNITGIDLINVSCTNTTSSPDRCTGLVSYGELLTTFPHINFRFICVDISETELALVEDRIVQLAAPSNTLMDFNISCALWFGGRGEGLVLDSDFVRDADWPSIRQCIISEESTESANENRRSKKNPKLPPTVNGGCLECAVCTRRRPKPGCVLSACKHCCRDLSCIAHTPIRPKEVLNINAFVQRHKFENNIVKSDCRVLLVGHGADELFGGYGRHETKSTKGGLEALRNEVLLDLGRLWQRNLGRDDRILGDSARDVRHPFLDESVIKFVGSLGVGALCSVDGQNKPILRELARKTLGMEIPASFRKRAIQFGTRIAQRTNIAKFGSHSRGSGTLVYQ